MEQNPSIKTTLEMRRWFSLPDDILRNIVSRLDLPQNPLIVFSDTVFKIQILSWKPDLWCILDNLFTVFCSNLITNFSLELHTTFYSEPCSSTILDSWARILRARNVQHLCLLSYAGVVRQVLYPPTIFRIHSLVSLEIDSCITEEIPLLVCNPITLPKLKKLNLGLVHCHRSLEWILRYCPSLEFLRLTIEDERPQKGKNGPILIAGKNLKQLFLHLESGSIIEVTINAPKLEEFHYNSNTFISMRMFDSISHVKSLRFLMGNSVRLYHSPTKTIFPNLSCLQLDSFSSYEVFDANVTMLHCCPNLDALKLDIDSKHMMWIPKARFAPIIEHVKIITLRTHSDRFDEHTLNLVTYFLRSSPILEKLIINGFYNDSDDNKLDKAQFLQTLRKCPKASSSCEIEFSRKYQLD